MCIFVYQNRQHSGSCCCTYYEQFLCRNFIYLDKDAILFSNDLIMITITVLAIISLYLILNSLKITFDMDTKNRNLIMGLSLCVMFIDYKYLVSALTVVILGFLITLIGYLADVKKQKFINDKLNEDIERIIQPLITKYSNLNKQYSSQYDGEEYIQKKDGNKS